MTDDNLQTEPHHPRPSDPPPEPPRQETIEPDVVRLGRIQGALCDQLVERRQARTGETADRARAGVLRDVITLGIAAVQAEEGFGA